MLAMIVLLGKSHSVTYEKCSPLIEIDLYPVIILVRIKKYRLPIHSPANNAQLDKPLVVRLVFFTGCVVLSLM